MLPGCREAIIAQHNFQVMTAKEESGERVSLLGFVSLKVIRVYVAAVHFLHSLDLH